jgi:GH25 family lysozyme M1 (1,4-beta-N-acetylmuramidase)
MRIFFSISASVVALVLGAAILLGPERAAAQRPLGIDVSSYQGNNVNWSNVLNAGVTWGWAKAAEGTLTDGYVGQDPDFTVNVTNAKAAGVVIGYYYYCHPEVDTNLAGADKEAQFFWSVVQPYMKADGLTLMPMLDFEQTLTNSKMAYTKASLSAWGNEWCQDIVDYASTNELIVTPVFYTYISYANGTSGNAPGFNDTVTQWPLDMANTQFNDPQTGAPGSTTPWSTWAFWQYNTLGTVSGIIGSNVDKDVFNGTAAGLADYIVAPFPPTISLQPTNETLIQGGTANLSVAASPGLISYQWIFFAGTNMVGTNMAGATNSTLTISNVQPEMTGNYITIVSNVSGSLYSSNATLTVLPMISNVSVVPRLASAVITWSTVTNATGQVWYGTTTNYGMAQPYNATLTTQHSALLNGLQFGMTYYYALVSSNGIYAGTNTGSFSTSGEIIVESSQAAYSGIWTVDSAAPDKYSQYYEYAGTAPGADTADAFFRPNIVTPGLYDVYFWYSEGTNRSLSAPVVVGYNGGGAELLVNEQTNGGSWQLLASGVPFATGTNGFVRLGNGTGETGRIVIADAAEFIYTSGQDLPTDNTPPAWWLSYYFGTNAVSASQDPDGDGYSTMAEYIAGTAPNDGTSYLRVNGQAAAGGGMQVVFSPYYPNSGRQYQLQGTSSLTNPVWANLPPPTITTDTNGNGVITMTNLTGSASYWRLSVSMSAQ